MPWPKLAKVIRPLGGHCVMLIAAPGVGKSTLALNWAARSQALTLYASADTDARTMTLQLASLASGHGREQVGERLANSAVWRQVYAADIRRQFPNLVMDFMSMPSIPSIAYRAEALTEVWGETPQLIVLDTASDLARDGDDYSAWRKLWLDSRKLARTFCTSVMLLHHVRSGPAATGLVRPNQDDGQYRADQFAEIELGMHWRNHNTVEVSVLKNRTGKRNIAVQMHADYEHARLEEVA